MNSNIIKSYQNQAGLRCSFNHLAGKTFDGLSFESWYQNGYWSHRYHPYSIVINNEVIANVSVNLMDFLWNGQKKHLIQLGTVMTDERFRRQGLIRQIMDRIDREYSQTADGIYLFANDNVLDFYPRFGFRRAMEYRFTKSFSSTLECRMVPVPMKAKEDWDKLEEAMNQSVPYSSFHMVDNNNLILFYVTGFMQENVYYDGAHDAYVIAGIDEDTLTVHNIFSKERYPLDDILAAFGSKIKKVILGFTPLETEGYTVSPFQEDDCTLFVKGEIFNRFEQERLIFPTLSHA